MKHLVIRVYGQVQGVFFRDSAKKEADKLGLLGFVRNEADGTVYIEAEGEKDKLKNFLEWCRKGPPFSRVDKTDEKWSGELKNFSEFEAV